MCNHAKYKIEVSLLVGGCRGAVAGGAEDL